MNKHQLPGEGQKQLFQVFNELAIIQQLASAAFNQCMPDGLHISHFSVINHLMRTGEGKTPLQIASALQVTKATMTHTMTVLQKRKLIKIQRNPSDGRSKLVYLTKSGESFQKKAIVALSPLLDHIGKECNVAELSAMLPNLQKLREVLDRNR